MWSASSKLDMKYIAQVYCFMCRAAGGCGSSIFQYSWYRGLLATRGGTFTHKSIWIIYRICPELVRRRAIFSGWVERWRILRSRIANIFVAFGNPHLSPTEVSQSRTFSSWAWLIITLQLITNYDWTFHGINWSRRKPEGSQVVKRIQSLVYSISLVIDGKRDKATWVQVSE